VVSRSCQAALAKRPGVQPSYYPQVLAGGTRSGARGESSPDQEADQ
jgi:hypothetical protein